MRKALDIEIGARLKQKRENCGYTRERLAELLGLSARSIANYEMGDNGVSLDTLKKLSIALHTSTDYILFGGTESDMDPVLSAINRVDKGHKAYLHAIVKAYIETYLKEGTGEYEQ